MQMLCGGVLLFAAGALSGEPARFALSRVSAGSALAVIYLVVFGSLIGFTAYTWLLRSASPVLVSTYAYVNPVVAVLLGCLLVHEPLTSRMVLGPALILGRVALVPPASARAAGPAVVAPLVEIDTTLRRVGSPLVETDTTLRRELELPIEIGVETCASP